MTNLPQKVVKNSNDWNEAINQLIDVCADLQGEAPTISDWSKDGIVLLNGTTWDVNAKGYRVAYFKHFRIVQLDLKLKGQITKERGVKMAELPDWISLDQMSTVVNANDWPGNLQGFSFFRLTNTAINNILILPNVPANGWTPGGTLSATYLTTIGMNK